MGGAVSKQFLMLRSKPIIVHTAERFQRCDGVDEIVIACHASDRPRFTALVADFRLSKVTHIVEGGVRRQDSVAKALRLVEPRSEIILVHDGVRPFVRRQTILDAIEKARVFSAAVAAVRVKDTVKMVDSDGRIQRTLDRSGLWMAQTPQAFHKQLLIDAYGKADREQLSVTDDASLVELMGIHPAIVEGDFDNIKITTPDDLDTARAISRRFKY